MRTLRVLLFAVLTISAAIAQQDQSQGSAPESAAQAAAKKDKKQPATTSAAQPELPVNSNSLLGLAAQHEQSGRRGVACRLYLRALVQSASNTADQR